MFPSACVNLSSQLKARSPAVTRNWTALYATLVEGTEAALPEEEEEDTAPPVVIAPAYSAAPAAEEAQDEEEGSTFLGIEIVREAEPPARSPVVTMERLPDAVAKGPEGPTDPAQTAFPRREERILKDSAMLGIEIVRESSSDEEDVVIGTQDEEVLRKVPPTVLMGDGVELPQSTSSLAAAYGLRASEPDADPSTCCCRCGIAEK